MILDLNQSLNLTQDLIQNQILNQILNQSQSLNQSQDQVIVKAVTRSKGTIAITTLAVIQKVTCV